MEKAYEAKKIEDQIYQTWEKSGFFNPDKLPGKRTKSFTISMPPPNATGTLHVGHAMMLAIQDLLIRYQRMLGKKALWLPGTDHAAIATHAKVERLVLEKENKTRQELGRVEFVKRIEEFVNQSRGTIKSQVRKMGSSCDWSREKYTLDPELSLAVRTQFTKMYNDGLIYRGYRIVNWCPRCHSTLADDEVEYQEEQGKLYWLKYGPFVLATARPETKLGDTAVAVYPTDRRYKSMVGKKYKIPGVLGEFEVVVVADKAVDPKFGSGAIKVTPAHSFIDYEIAQRHHLPFKQIINEEGRMMENCGKYAGLTTREAREAIVADMKNLGLIDHIEDGYDHNLAVCYRCGSLIEPLPSEQWFIDVNKKFKIQNSKLKGIKSGQLISLKELMQKTVKSGQIEIIPERFNKVYFHWIDNLRDWCISRQIWFGHPIPAWYRQRTANSEPRTAKDIYVGVEAPKGDGWEQDPDTLDTWFSSGLWTFSTLGWPKKTKDLDFYHPTTVMETGYDILFFWVARMILMTTYALGDIPFETVYLHGLVRDEKNRKMSKSLGNVIDPLEVINKYGTDALRLSYLIGITPGQDLKLYDEKFVGARNFVNKLWNISRYILESNKAIKPALSPSALLRTDSIERQETRSELQTLADRWILSRLNKTIVQVTGDLDNYDFSAAGERLREFTWGDLADWYLEISKVENGKGEILTQILRTILKLWHPFMPFVTEEIWSKLNGKSGGLLMIENWPVADKKLFSEAAEKDFDLIREIITTIRNLRAENQVAPAKKIKLIIVAGGAEKLVQDQSHLIKFLARVEELELVKKAGKIKTAATAVVNGVEIYLPLADLIDLDKEKIRLVGEVQNLEEYLAGLRNKLANNNFLTKAPAELVQEAKDKAIETEEKIKKLKEQLGVLR
ncbi:MAG: valine--tRNA ligase [Patescibacteria group bacterium]